MLLTMCSLSIQRASKVQELEAHVRVLLKDATMAITLRIHAKLVLANLKLM